MTLEEIIEEVKLEVTGAGVLELEISDDDIKAVIKNALRELQRYWDETSMVTIPFASCIDYTGTPLEDSLSIVKVYRTAGVGNADDSTNALTMDPLYAQQWMIFSNAGTMYCLQDYVMNYAAWNTLIQVRNTMSTDMAFEEDRHNHKLYINCANSNPGAITVKYIPKLKEVEDIKSIYWQDILVRMVTALTKITLGRIRTRYTQSNALWTQDGERMLEEGNTALTELRETLRVNSNYVYPID